MNMLRQILGSKQWNLKVNKLSTFLILCAILVISTNIFAQENSTAEDDFEEKLLKLKNPFKSLLFEEEKEEIVPETPGPEIETPSAVGEEKVEVNIEEVTVGLPEESIEPPAPSEIIEPEQALEVIQLPLPDVIVSGIIWNSDRPQAIINNRIVDIDSAISGIKITEIHQSGIKGLFDGKAVTIKQKGVNYD